MLNLLSVACSTILSLAKGDGACKPEQAGCMQLDRILFAAGLLPH